MTVATRDEILTNLTEAFTRASNGRADGARVAMEARIIEDLGLSSLDLLELRAELEERFEIEVSDKELMQLKTVADVVQLIESHTAAG